MTDPDAGASMTPELRKRKSRVSWKLLYILIALALLAVVIEGYLIHCLRMRSPEQDKANNEEITNAKQIHEEIKHMHRDLTKPSAHVTGCKFNTSNDGKLSWEPQNGDAYTYEMDYKDGALVIKKEGYYFIYSKIIYGERDCKTGHLETFKHTVFKITQTVSREVELMSSVRSYCKNDKEGELVNSFLGGIYYLLKGNQIFVTVTETKNILVQTSAENVFGAFLM
ncbi:tumor necrosis factor ligand superfamily member 14-like [Lepisosteus oculatus]|uniref:tumor necrosis factor ligand superfamily member 14-like n=1 Tax=Lepisosteus oculatus TaxID=7918 RepID=UPI00073FC7C9|nr:PREDICTED: tumor necrosis factor ligand superfamily member 14-like [Lepisosteus oculatus]